MIFKLLLSLLLLNQTYCFQIRNEITGRKNAVEDDPSFPLHENLRDELQKGMLSAGNTRCKSDHPCGYYNKTYTWCNTDDGSWDYCCAGPCNGEHVYYKCNVGNRYIWSYCGTPSWKTVTGEQCLSSHPCGTHGSESTNAKYWCYKDEEKYWEYCCNPSSKCSDNGSGYECYTGIHLRSYLKKCTP